MSFISIHALREEGDLLQKVMLYANLISIHALREEGDFFFSGGVFYWGEFLSTPSARRATSMPSGASWVLTLFLSTPSARRATGASSTKQRRQAISIHALREEGDRVGRAVGPVVVDISIHALREEGDVVGDWVLLARMQFLSTPSARRATASSCKLLPYFIISIHALREEGDLGFTPTSSQTIYFYPRPPRGGRPYAAGRGAAHHYFYPRPPRGGRQQKQRQNLYFQTNYTTFCTNLEEP